MKISKLLLRTTPLFLLALTFYRACSASNHALRYLKVASTAAWQAAKTTAQWAAKNPYKVAGGMIVAESSIRAHNIEKEFEKHSNEIALKAQRCAAAVQNPRIKEIMRWLTEECKLHGLEEPFFLLTDGPDFDVSCNRAGQRIFLIASRRALNQIVRHEAGLPSSMSHWKEIVLHELGHAKAYHTRTGRACKATLESDDFRQHATATTASATGLAAARSVASLFARASGHQPPTALVGIVSLSVVPIIGFATYFSFKRIADTSWKPLALAWSRKREREADAYVAQVAFERKDPQILDNYAQDHQNHHESGVRGGTTHPTHKERAETARAAAAELREEIRTGKPALAPITYHCSPF